MNIIDKTQTQLISIKQACQVSLCIQIQNKSALIQSLKDDLKAIEVTNKKFYVQFSPQILESEAQQLKLLDEFLKLKRDIDTYSSFFKLESQMRLKAILDKDYAESQVQKLVDMLGKQKSKNKEIKELVKQKELIINRIVESKRESMQGVEEMKQLKEKAEQELEKQKIIQNEMLEKQKSLEKKYQEMFEINTHFNKRIYELEKQKKDLLDLLKQNHIEPDPTKFTQLN